MISTFNIQAQVIAKSEMLASVSFHQMDIDEQRKLIQLWLNKSESVSLSQDIRSELEVYYQGHSIHPKAAAKYNLVYKTLYNEKLEVMDRINYCSFILQNYTEEEVSLEHIQQLKIKLMQRIQDK